MSGLPVERPVQPPRRGPAALGDALRRHRPRVAAMQWAAVALYALLVVGPVLAPAAVAPRFAGLVMWGVAWPLALLGVVFVGRIWCGLLCPEGTVTEWVSRYGQGRTIPRWMRWRGWPFAGFVVLTVWGQLLDVVRRPEAVLALLAATMFGAVVVGALVGRGTRVWCRYLCPVTGVLGLLARLSPLAFQTDPAAWKRHTGPTPRVWCPTMLDLRRLDSVAECHACGRCSGHRGAIAWTLRSPWQEILHPGRDDTGAAPLLLFGLLGVAAGALQWATSPLYGAWREALAGLLGAPWPALLSASAPGWLLAPSLRALDGIAIVLYIAAHAAFAGAAGTWAVGRAARLLSLDARGRLSLAYALLPVAAAGLAIGLSWQAQRLLGVEAAAVADVLRATLLAGACAGSLALARRIAAGSAVPAATRRLALLLYALPVALAAAGWALAG